MTLKTKEPVLVVQDEAAGMYYRLRNHTASPADKLFIFAPSKAAADQWARDNEFNCHEVTYISNYVQLRALRTKAFPRVFLPGWRSHPQFRSIGAELAIRDRTALPAGWRP